MKKAAEAGVTTEGVISNERPYLNATDPDNGMKIEQGKMFPRLINIMKWLCFAQSLFAFWRYFKNNFA